MMFLSAFFIGISFGFFMASIFNISREEDGYNKGFKDVIKEGHRRSIYDLENNIHKK